MPVGNIQTKSPDELYCGEKAFVIRNRALAVRYPGGAGAFFEEFLPDQFNEEIAVFLGPIQNKLWDCILGQDLEHNTDFLFVDIDLFVLSDNTWPYPPDQEVTWLIGRIENGAVYVSFIESQPPSGQSDQGWALGLHCSLTPAVGNETSQPL